MRIYHKSRCKKILEEHMKDMEIRKTICYNHSGVFKEGQHGEEVME